VKTRLKHAVLVTVATGALIALSATFTWPA
jgi:hypothetical protein